MNGNHTLRLVGFAGCTSLGYTLEASLAAMGAGLSNFTESGIWNLFGTPATAGALLEPGLPRGERLTALARIGLAETASLLAQVGLSRVPLILGIASDLTREEGEALSAELRDSDIVPSTAWMPHGRASALLALESAGDLVRRGAHRAVLVGGIDSLCAPETIRQLVSRERVLGPHTEGTIPAEAAVFTLIVRANDEILLPTSVLLEATAHARGQPFSAVDRITADALAGVFLSLRERSVTRVDRVVAAHSGEGYFGRSFTHAYLREVEIMPEPLEVDTPASSVGDVGAGVGVLALAVAMYRLAAAPDEHPRGRVLVYSESDSGEVAAAVVQGTPASWQRQATL